MKRILIMSVMIFISMAAQAMEKISLHKRDVSFMLRPDELKISGIYTFEGTTYAYTGHVFVGTEYERYLFVELVSLLPENQKQVGRQLQYDSVRNTWTEFVFGK